MSTLAARPMRHFVDANVALSQRTERRFHLASDKPLWQRFQREAAERIRALPDGATVLDLGGGRRCVYAQAVPADRDIRLVAVDISAEELAANEDVTETRVADISKELPFPDGSVDLVVSRALLEHAPDVPAAARHMARVLKPGGVALHLVPGRYSLFGLAARLLPFKPLLGLVHLVMPWTKGQVEFDVYYDHCHPAALERMFREAGCRSVDVEVCWAQPGYFVALFPLFLAHAAYECVVRRLGIRRLASYMLVRAER